MAYMYSPCNGNCCGCNPASTFLRIFVRDSCNNAALEDATVTITLLGNPIASGPTDALGFFSTSITKTGTYSVVVSKTGYANSTTAVTITGINCSTTVNRTVTLTRNRVLRVTSAVTVTCGENSITGVTATLSQAGSTTANATADSSGNLVFNGSFLTGVTATMVVSVNNALYTPSTQTKTNVFITGDICGGGTMSTVTWDGRSCPTGTGSTGGGQTPPNLIAGYICAPIGGACGTPYQVGDLNINDPEVGAGSLTYLDCYQLSTPFEGVWWGPVWRGTLTYNSPACSRTCTVGGVPCTVTFPATTATITYTVGYNRLTTPSDQFALGIEYSYRNKNCLLGGGCNISQIADSGYLDTTQNPPTGVFWPISGSIAGRVPYATATCPPGIVITFNAGALTASTSVPCTNTNPTRTVTVTA